MNLPTVYLTPPPSSDWRRLCIEELADSEAALLERVAGLEADVAAYRLVAQTALTALADLTQRYDRLRDRLHVLVNDLRAVRNQKQRAA